MSAQPTRKISNSKKGKRNSHRKIVFKNIIVCPNCSSPKLPHHVCNTCGLYGGWDVLRKGDNLERSENATEG